MRLNVDIPRVVRPEFRPLPFVALQADGICAGSPYGEALEHISQGEATAACGACSSLMVLKKHIATKETVDKVLKATHVYDPDWTPVRKKDTWEQGSSPVGIAEAMRGRLPATLDPAFNVDVFNDRDALTRAICWSIAAMKADPIVLVHKRQHWVVVDMCKVSKMPTSPADRDYSICFLYLQDPAFGNDPRPIYAGKPYHEALTENEWKRTYIDLPVPSIKTMPTERYASKFVAITYEDALAANIEGAENGGAAAHEDGELYSCGDDRLKDKELIDDGWELFGDDPWSMYRGGTVESNVTLTVLDHQQPNQYTCLTAYIPSGSSLQDSQIVLITRAERGYEFRSAVGTTLDGRLDVGTGILYLMPSEQVVEFLVNSQPPLDIGGRKFRPVLADIGTPPLLFWEPYVESMSPYLPFYEINTQELNANGVPEGPIVTVYLRLDGQPFLTVTPIWPASEVEPQEDGIR